MRYRLSITNDLFSKSLTSGHESTGLREWMGPAPSTRLLSEKATSPCEAEAAKEPVKTCEETPYVIDSKCQQGPLLFGPLSGSVNRVHLARIQPS